jgi:hypothetical protein
MFVWEVADLEADAGFVAGLIAGDGHFAIRPNNGGSSWTCALAVRLRADDTPLLAQVCRWSGVGRLTAVPARSTSHPQTVWTVQRQADCLRMVEILSNHLRIGKKAGEFELWRAAVEAWVLDRGDRFRTVEACGNRLRAYRDPTNVFVPGRVSITESRLLAFLAGFVTAEAHLGATPEGRPS